MCPIEIDFNVEDLVDISKGVDIVVPPINLAFIQIHLATQGKKEKIERLLETPRYLSGCAPRQDGIISEEHMINGLNPYFEGESWNHSLLKLSDESSTQRICH